MPTVFQSYQYKQLKKRALNFGCWSKIKKIIEKSTSIKNVTFLKKLNNDNAFCLQI